MRQREQAAARQGAEMADNRKKEGRKQQRQRAGVAGLAGNRESRQQREQGAERKNFKSREQIYSIQQRNQAVAAEQSGTR